MRVIVCGGRDFDDADFVSEALDAFNEKHGPISHVIEGGAIGADHLARQWATRNEIMVSTVPARWSDQGNSAGPIRNQLMIDLFAPNFVIAFEGGRGTEDMIRRGKRVCPVFRPRRKMDGIIFDDLSWDQDDGQ